MRPSKIHAKLIAALYCKGRVRNRILIKKIWGVDCDCGDYPKYMNRLKKLIERARKRGYLIACHRNNRDLVWYELL